MSRPLNKSWEGAPWTPRDWQAEALPRAMQAIEKSHPVVRAVTGAGKSILLAELAHLTEGRVVVTTPSTKLVKDLAGTLHTRGVDVGRYYGKTKQTRRRVIVCCNDSLPSLSERIDPPELWIADEAHKTECARIKNVVEGPLTANGERLEESAWVPRRRCGFTATPYRADTSEEISLFDELAYDYGPGRAITDGVVLPPKVVHYHGDADKLDRACLEMIQGASGPGIVDALNISDAEEFCTLLNANGVKAEAVHSRHGDYTITRRLGKLERGELNCLVHVSLLSEGVDLPWLRWLCCRRPISSRVLFAQYIGRGIRKHEGKTHCVVYDPQDLFGKLSLDYEAILSGGVDEPDDDIELPALAQDWDVGGMSAPISDQETLREAPVEAIDPTISYIRRLRIAFQSMGFVRMRMDDAEWRSEEPTETQLNRIDKYAWLVVEPEVPPRHSRALRMAIRAVEDCDRGTASDLISILNVLEYGWPEGAEEEVAA